MAEQIQQRFLDATLPHLDAVYRLARHLSGDRWQAEDLVQETYLRAFAAFDSHVGPSTRAWIVTICLNLARSDGRRRGRRVVERPLGPLAEERAGAADVAGEVEGSLEREAVVRALRQLPAEQRLAIVLMDLAGHTAAETAALLGCPRGTVLARVHRGRRRLAGLLAGLRSDHDVS